MNPIQLLLFAYLVLFLIVVGLGRCEEIDEKKKWTLLLTVLDLGLVAPLVAYLTGIQNETVRAFALIWHGMGIGSIVWFLRTKFRDDVATTGKRQSSELSWWVLGALTALLFLTPALYAAFVELKSLVSNGTGNT